MHDTSAIMNEILRGYALPIRGSHGIVHWARVLENGLRIADVNGADREVVTLFAVFHDSRRINEYDDDGHGLRGGEFARSLRGSLVNLDDGRFELLFEACRLPADGLTSIEPTMQAFGTPTGWTWGVLESRRSHIDCARMPQGVC